MRIAFCQEVHLAPVRTSLWAAGLLVKKRTSSFSDSRGHNYLRTSLVLLDMHIRHVPLFSPSCRCKVTQPTYQFFFFFFLFSPPDFAHEVGKGSVEFLFEGIVRFGERSFVKEKKKQTEELRDFCDEMLIEERNSELMVLKKFLSSIDTDNLVRFLKNKIEQRCREEYDC